MGVIFDLDQTIIDSSIALEARRNRIWSQVYSLIPFMKPYNSVVELIKLLVKEGVEVAVVTSSPRPYCEKVLKHLGIHGVITVCYHDTKKHKPDPEPYKYAISKMKNQDGKSIVIVGDQENDILAAHSLNRKVISILVYWDNPNYLNESHIQPFLFCSDQECLLNFFSIFGIRVNPTGLRERSQHTYQLFDYYPKTKVHDMFSEKLLKAFKRGDEVIPFCKTFCNEFKNKKWELPLHEYGVFVVPSSKVGKWNKKLTEVVVPQLVADMKLINCANYILRHTEHEKQAYGGNRSIQSNLNTIRLQYKLPPNLKGAFIIDDITTSGKTFEACIQVLTEAGLSRDNIYCVAIGGTVYE